MRCKYETRKGEKNGRNLRVTKIGKKMRGIVKGIENSEECRRKDIKLGIVQGKRKTKWRGNTFHKGLLQPSSWKTPRKSMTKKVGNKKLRHPNGKILLRKLYMASKNKTKEEKWLDEITAEKKRLDKWMEKANRIIELLVDGSDIVETHLPMPHQPYIFCDAEQQTIISHNKHIKRVKVRGVKCVKKRMFRGPKENVMLEVEMSEFESGVVDQPHTDDDKKEIVERESGIVLRSDHDSKFEEGERSETDGGRKKLEIPESGVLDQAHTDESVEGLTTSDQIRHLCGKEGIMEERVIPITVNSMVDEEEDQVGTLLQLLEGNEYPRAEPKKGRIKRTDTKYREKLHRKRMGIPEPGEYIKEAKLKTKLTRQRFVQKLR